MHLLIMLSNDVYDFRVNLSPSYHHLQMKKMKKEEVICPRLHRKQCQNSCFGPFNLLLVCTKILSLFFSFSGSINSPSHPLELKLYSQAVESHRQG